MPQNRSIDNQEMLGELLSQSEIAVNRLILCQF